MIKKVDIQLEESWKTRLTSEFEQPYMQNLKAFLLEEKRLGKVIFPNGSNIFAALNHAVFDKIKVVILGQDPYHGPNQAHGLCFSVQKDVAIPPSLRNIYLELKKDIAFTIPNHGCLINWADQGVLLLNSVLTVEQGKPASHEGKGWEIFTDRIIELLNQERENLVFMLWGNYARKKGAIIDRSRHLVLESAHPSPLSAQKFFGCKHFSKANAYLVDRNIQPIDWAIPA